MARADRYGPIIKFHVGRRLSVYVGDADEINRVLRERPDGFRRWPEVEAAFEGIGFPGVFSVEGDALAAPASPRGHRPEHQPPASALPRRPPRRCAGAWQATASWRATALRST